MGCSRTELLSSALAVQAVAAAVYFLLTLHNGAALEAALAGYPPWAALRESSERKRRNAAVFGLVVGLAMVAIYRPFARREPQ